MSIVQNADDIRKKLESTLAESKAELECLTKLNDLTLGIVGIIEIEKFKQEKLKLYQKVLHSVSGFELKSCTVSQQLWQELLSIATGLMEK